MMEIANTMLSSELQVFLNYVYEYKKGVRNMVLCTLNRRYLAAAVARLDDQGICHFEQSANENNVNLYFGKSECIAAVRQFIVRPLHQLSPEEDFILGALLGYDICLQCERFCTRKKRADAMAQCAG